MGSAAASIRTLVWSGLLLFTLLSAAGAQTQTAAQEEIRAALTQWTADFNAGHAHKVCELFAPDLIAQYQGQPERDYDALCDLLRRSLNDGSKSYNYSLVIKEILVDGDLAVVRLIWTLKMQRRGTPGEIALQEPGMDIFRRQPDGSWKISRYIAYEASP